MIYPTGARCRVLNHSLTRPDKVRLWFLDSKIPVCLLSSLIGEFRIRSKSVWTWPSREAAQAVEDPKPQTRQKLVVVEILSQDEPSLTALNQEADHQKQDQLEGIMGVGGKKISLGGDNPSFSPRYVRLQKSAAHAVLPRSKSGYETKESSIFAGLWSSFFSYSCHWACHFGPRPNGFGRVLIWCWNSKPWDFYWIKKHLASWHLLLRSGSVQHYWNEIFYFVHHLAHKFIR